MASGFFAILDDIAMLMDDVATLSKVATKKTAGILGDDLAVNAEKATGFVSSRELPVLWAITKGSFLNKLIILPIVFVLNFIFPFAIKIILVLGGLFLAYEGAEKIIEFIFHRNKGKGEVSDEIKIGNVENAENSKVKSAIRTDFILSLEIVIIALSTVTDKTLYTQIVVVSFVALVATVGVYGIVALIVRMDDAGFYLINKSKENSVQSKIGAGLIKLLPLIIKILSILGTVALLLVAGGIFAHNSHYLHNLFHNIPELLRDFTLGLVFGSIVVLLINLFKKIFVKKTNINKND